MTSINILKIHIAQANPVDGDGVVEPEVVLEERESLPLLAGDLHLPHSSRSFSGGHSMIETVAQLERTLSREEQTVLDQEAFREQQNKLQDSLHRSVEREQNIMMQHQIMDVQSGGPLCSTFKPGVSGLNSEFGVDTSGARSVLLLHDPPILIIKV